MEKWQREHIQKNIRQLVDYTSASLNVAFLLAFQERGLLTTNDVISIRTIEHPFEKCLAFYEIIQRKVNSYEILKAVLKEAKLAKSVQILNQINLQNATSFKACGTITYNTTKLLRGSYNTKVFQGRFDGMDVAVKILSVEDVNLDDTLREIDILKTLDGHPNVVRYFKAESTEDVILIAMELCNLDLNQFVKMHELNHAVAIFNSIKQITKGLSFLHSKKILHGDLKPENILIFCPHPEKLHVKLSDYGISQTLPEGVSRIGASDLLGNPGWMAPEVIRQLDDEINPMGVLHVTQAADIFSLGCIFYYVLSHGQHPFGKSLIRDANIINERSKLDTETIKIPEKFRAEAFVWLINQMIKDDGMKRPNTNIISAHPAFWETTKCFSFFEDIYPYIDDSQVDEIFSKACYNNTKMEGWNWLNVLDNPVKGYLKQTGVIDGTKGSHLLKIVVEMYKYHINLPENIQQLLSNSPDEYFTFWGNHFPYLLIVIWTSSQNSKNSFSHLKTYHPLEETNFTFSFFGPRLGSTAHVLRKSLNMTYKPLLPIIYQRKPTLEMEQYQQQHIQQNISKLVQCTTCDIIFLLEFQSKGLLTQDEITKINSIQHPLEKSFEFYKLIQTKPNSYEPLKAILHNTMQTGALSVLDQIDEQNSTLHLFKKFGTISYDKTKLIGRGSYNTKVYQGRFENRDVAVKILNIDYVHIDIALKEIYLLTNLDWHENIVRYFKAECTEDFVLIAFELCKMDLDKYVALSNQVNAEACNIIKQITEGLIFLHSKQIVHRDLKPSNILISCHEEGKLYAKLSDFGLSRKVQDGMSRITVSEVMGTPGWMAPEVIRQIDDGVGLRENVYFRKTGDIFSLGCIFYFVLTGGEHPFGRGRRREGNILDGKSQLDLGAIKLDEKFRAEAFNWLINQMIKDNEKERPKANIILSHPAFWETKKMFAFFEDIYPYLDDMCIDDVIGSESRIITKIEKWNWLSALDNPLKNYLEANIIVDGTKYSHLLKVIVETYRNYFNLPKDVQQLLSNSSETYFSFWGNRFHNLLILIWTIYQKSEGAALILKSYYPMKKSDFTFSFFNPNHDKLVEIMKTFDKHFVKIIAVVKEHFTQNKEANIAIDKEHQKEEPCEPLCGVTELQRQEAQQLASQQREQELQRKAERVASEQQEAEQRRQCEAAWNLAVIQAQSHVDNAIGDLQQAEGRRQQVISNQHNYKKIVVTKNTSRVSKLKRNPTFSTKCVYDDAEYQTNLAIASAEVGMQQERVREAEEKLQTVRSRKPCF